MPAPSDAQAAFVAALRQPQAPPPAGIRGRGAETPKRRFDVYRNNVHASLIDVLAARYPVTERLVGSAFFREMARVFVARALPSSPVLLEYGGDFAAFVDGFQPVAALPYVGDVVRLEWAWHEAYHAADAEPLDPGTLTRLWSNTPPELLVASQLSLHPSLRLVRSPWPVLEIWRTNTHDEEVQPVDLHAGGDELLVLRPHWQVELRRLPPGGPDFLAALAAGQALGAAAEHAAGAAPAFDLGGNLRGLVEAGGLVGVRDPCPGEHP